MNLLNNNIEGLNLDETYKYLGTLQADNIKPVAVLDFKNWGGGKYGASQNNVRTFFLLHITVIAYYIIYTSYIISNSGLRKFFFGGDVAMS